MRHRKVLNLYDTDRGHEELLIYLESIEGAHKQQQALLQMLMVGFRVVASHESGDEAYYGVRNPDVRAARKISAPRLPAKPRRDLPAIGVPVEVDEKPSDLDKPAETRAAESQELPMAGPSTLPGYLEQTSQEDEYNTLKILRMMDEGED